MGDVTKADIPALVDELRSLATSLKRPGGEESRVTKACARAADRIEALKALLQRFVWKERGIMADLSTAHSNRGQGAASWMREDDRDQVEALEKLFVETRAALAATPETEGE